MRYPEVLRYPEIYVIYSKEITLSIEIIVNYVIYEHKYNRGCMPYICVQPCLDKKVLCNTHSLCVFMYGLHREFLFAIKCHQ